MSESNPDILFLSDLHLDIWADAGLDPLSGITSDAQPGHVVVAGDLCNNGAKRWPRYLAQLQARFPEAQIIILPGNHDYYGACLDREDKLADAASAAGAIFAQKTAIVIGDLRLLCCSLWTDFRLSGEAAQFMSQYVAERGMNDYRKIRLERDGYRRISPSHTAAIHHEHRLWLQEQLEIPFEGRTAVVTHHAPHPKALMESSAPELDPAYASDLTGMISDHQPDFWIHGHTHASKEVSLGATVMKNVCLGYPWENKALERPRSFLDLKAQLGPCHPEPG